MSMYVAYYKMLGMSPDLPVWVEADNYLTALHMFQTWRDRKEQEGYGYLIATVPFKIESDDARDNPKMGRDLQRAHDL